MNRKQIGEIYAKTNGRCWYCGAALRPFSDWEIEHQVPKNQGGSNDRENLVPACRACNSRKGRRTVEEYRHALIVKMEHHITGAVEYAYELSAAFGNDPSTWMPEDLLRIHDGLSGLADQAVRLGFKFFWEREAEAIERIRAIEAQPDVETAQ